MRTDDKTKEDLTYISGCLGKGRLKRRTAQLQLD
jgi:hypothetical protein